MPILVAVRPNAQFAAVRLLSESRCGNGCLLWVLRATSWSLVHKSPTIAVRRCVWSRNLRMRKQGPHLAEGPQEKQIMPIHTTHIHIYIQYGGIYCAPRSWNSVGTLPHLIMVTDSNTKWLLLPKTVSCWEEVDLLVSIASPVFACKACDDRHRLAHLASRDICHPSNTSWHLTVKYTTFTFAPRIKCTLVQALRLCTGRTAHRGSKGIALPFHDHGTRRGWGVSVTPRPLFIPGKDPVPIVQEAGWAPGPVWTGAKNLAPTEIRPPDRPARSQSLDRLRYPAQDIWQYTWQYKQELQGHQFTVRHGTDW